VNDELEPWRALVDVYQAVLHDVVDALEREAGIDSGAYSVLAHLDRAGSRGRTPMAELQRLMHPRYSQPGLSRLIQRMEAAGLIERRVDPADGRATTVHITRAGRARFGRAHRVYATAVQEHFLVHLDGKQRDRLARELRTVLDARASL
jgi:DNA-binding MarR family transcriptional regulator